MYDITTFSGKCYCGRCRVSCDAQPLTICYCHCSDCRRLTGSPLPAFAGFEEEVAVLHCENAASEEPTSHAEGVTRWFCRDCGSAMMAKFDYVPGQVMVPLGLFDDLEKLVPQMHTHEANRPSWLHIDDDLPRDAASGRARLNTRPA